MATPKSHTASLRVPKGFFDLMEVFVRDLLKNKPHDVFEHGAKFFEGLLQVRTTTGHDPAVHGAKSQDGFISAPRSHFRKSKKRKHSKKKSTAARGQSTDRSDTKPGAAGISEDAVKTALTEPGETGV